MKLAVSHVTRYRYAREVGFGTHRLYVRPRENHHLRVGRFGIDCRPRGRVRWIRDPMENSIALLDFNDKAVVLEVTVEFEAELLEDNPFDFLLAPHAVRFPFAYEPEDLPGLLPYLDTGQCRDSLRVSGWLRRSVPNPPEETVPLLTLLNRLVNQSFLYQRRESPGIQTPDETIRVGSGSCRDFAVLFAAVCRRLGLAARFVSGYLYDPPGEDGTGSNRAHGSMHAWTEVFLPGAGWKGFDPTNGILCSDYFIPVAVARYPETINPVQGGYLGETAVENTMESLVEVRRVE